MNRLSSVTLQLEAIESRITPTVTYHGGALLKNVEAQAIYLGSDWNSPTLSSTRHDLETFVNYLVTSPYMDALHTAGYGVGQGSATPGVVAATAINKNVALSEASIEQQLQSLISRNQVAQPDADRLYVLYVEPGVAVRDSEGLSSTTDFNGFHGAFLGRAMTGRAADIRYAVVPYPGEVNPTAISQGFLSTFAALTTYTSHELAEAVTDPDVNYKAPGWYDDDLHGEICDFTRQTQILGGYTVHKFVDKVGQTVTIGTSESDDHIYINNNGNDNGNTNDNGHINGGSDSTNGHVNSDGENDHNHTGGGGSNGNGNGGGSDSEHGNTNGNNGHTNGNNGSGGMDGGNGNTGDHGTNGDHGNINNGNSGSGTDGDHLNTGHDSGNGTDGHHTNTESYDAWYNWYYEVYLHGGTDHINNDGTGHDQIITWDGNGDDEQFLNGNGSDEENADHYPKDHADIFTVSPIEVVATLPPQGESTPDSHLWVSYVG